MYLTYDEYKSLGGTADEGTFTRLCMEACGRIDRLTHGRLRMLADVPPEARAAAFELIRRASASEEEPARMSGFTNDGMSVTFAVEDDAQREAALNGVVIDLLWGVKAADGRTPVLYAGVSV